MNRKTRRLLLPFLLLQITTGPAVCLEYLTTHCTMKLGWHEPTDGGRLFHKTGQMLQTLSNTRSFQIQLPDSVIETYVRMARERRARPASKSLVFSSPFFASWSKRRPQPAGRPVRWATIANDFTSTSVVPDIDLFSSAAGRTIDKIQIPNRYLSLFFFTISVLSILQILRQAQTRRLH